MNLNHIKLNLIIFISVYIKHNYIYTHPFTYDFVYIYNNNCPYLNFKISLFRNEQINYI